MDSGGSSSFWFYPKGGTPGTTEIDVFEIGGKAKGFERKYNMTLHVTEIAAGKEALERSRRLDRPVAAGRRLPRLRRRLGAGRDPLFVDGVLVRSVENTHWHQPLYLIFDSETMPKWFGMPDDKDLPSTFSVEYVRAWKKKS